MYMDPLGNLENCPSASEGLAARASPQGAPRSGSGLGLRVLGFRVFRDLGFFRDLGCRVSGFRV